MRGWIGLAVVGMLLGGTVARADTAAQPANMVRNGDFEQTDGNGLGRDWANESYGTGKRQFSLDSDRAHVGKYCQHIRVEEYNDGGAQVRQLGMKLAKGQSYSIVLWMRGNLTVPVRVGFRKHDKPYTFYLKQEFAVTPAWQRFTISGVAPEDDNDSGLYIFFAGNGDLWIDSVSAQASTAVAATIRAGQ